MNTKFKTSTLVYRLAGDLNVGPTPLPPSNYEQSVQHLPKRPTSKFGKMLYAQCWGLSVWESNQKCKYSWYRIAWVVIKFKNFENNDKLHEQLCQCTMGMACSSEVRAAAAIAEDVGFDSLPCPQFSDFFRNWCPHHYWAYIDIVYFTKNGWDYWGMLKWLLIMCWILVCNYNPVLCVLRCARPWCCLLAFSNA